jgi:hypothetical protein
MPSVDSLAVRLAGPSPGFISSGSHVGTGIPERNLPFDFDFVVPHGGPLGASLLHQFDDPVIGEFVTVLGYLRRLSIDETGQFATARRLVFGDRLQEFQIGGSKHPLERLETLDGEPRGPGRYLFTVVECFEGRFEVASVGFDSDPYV